MTERHHESAQAKALRLIQRDAWIEGFEARNEDFWAECPYGDPHEETP